MGDEVCGGDGRRMGKGVRGMWWGERGEQTDLFLQKENYLERFVWD